MAPSDGYPPEFARFTRPAGGTRLPYGTAPQQYGELRLPPGGGGPHPVAVLIHGGYWRNRYALDLMNALAGDLVEAGFAVWNLEYRRIGDPGGGVPGTLADVAAGLDALADLAREHPLDLERVGVVGHSAGGHLALWLPARERTPWGGDARVRVRVVLALAPVADLLLAHEWKLSADAAAELVGASAEEEPELYRLASPAALLPLGVPQILVHGDADEDVPPELSARHHRAALAAGDACELVALPGADHFAVIDPDSAAWAEARNRLEAALRR